MPATILVAYATKHGSTREVACAVAETLHEHGLAVDTLPAARVDDLSPYTGVVLGGAIYMGRWHPDAVAFLKRHRRTLATTPVWIFGMGPRTLAEDDLRAARKQVMKALAKVPEIHPVAVAVFGGVIEPRTLRFPLNRIPAGDARDWPSIRAWATDVAEAFAFGKAASEAGDDRSVLQQSPR